MTSLRSWSRSATQKLIDFFQPPVFLDEDKNQTAKLLHTISLAILCLLIIVSLLSPFIFQDPEYGLILSGITALPVIGVLWMIHLGQMKVGSHLFVIGIFVLDTILIYFTEGLHSGVLPGYVALAVIAGLLLSRRSAIILIACMAMTGLGMVCLDTNALIPPPIIYLDPLARWLSLLVNVTLAAMVLDLANTGLKNALERARLVERAVASANKDLKHEIAERSRTEDELRRLKEFNENIVQSAAETIILEDEHGFLTFANPRIKKLLGYLPEEIIGEHWSKIVANEQIEKVTVETKKRVDGIESQYETLLTKKDGTMLPVIASARPLFNQGQFVGVITAFTDITERRKAEAQLLHDAFHDGLTNLPNRALFYDRMRQSIARASRHDAYHYAVLFLDLDRFKLINDSLGHNMGDKFLILVAERLSSFLRSVDTIARLGGDEFVILLDDIPDIGKAVSIADRIQEALKIPFNLEGHEIYTTASIGVVYNANSYESPEAVLRDADTAMYRAKGLGKDRYELFDPKMRQDVVSRMQIETELRRAYERGEFQVYYQPLISIQTDRIIGLEALLRWHHPQRGRLLPGYFLKVAEETGVIIPIGKWIFMQVGEVIQQIMKEFPQEPPLFVSINLSRKQFAYPGLIADIEGVIKEKQLDPRCLVLEITEDVIMDDTLMVTDKIKQIQDLGVIIQMDDFGTGYSSLATLNRYPIGALKIAREFIEEIESSEDRSEIIRTIISLARILNINVIAEGVENIQQLEYLRKEKCDIWQGYFCSEPICRDGLSKFLAEKLI